MINKTIDPHTKGIKVRTLLKIFLLILIILDQVAKSSLMLLIFLVIVARRFLCEATSRDFL